MASAINQIREREWMEARDSYAKGLFVSKYGSEEERKSAMEEKLSTTLSSPSGVVCIATSEIHSLKFAEFQATCNAPFEYPTDTAYFWKSLHATPADDLLCSAHPLHTNAFWSEAIQFDGITYNTEFEPLGLKHEDWTRDIVEPMRRIYRESFEARQKFARELRSSPASHDHVLGFYSGGNHFGSPFLLRLSLRLGGKV